MRAYLDIETGWNGEITVLGMYVPGRLMLQLVGDEVTADNLLWYATGLAELRTYNGHCFDLRIIKSQLGVDLREHLESVDLMHLCWKQNLKGGLKAVERQLGIVRRHPSLGGWDAMRLWKAWRHSGDSQALNVLLEYNMDDCVNLHCLEAMLEGSAPPEPVDFDHIILPALPAE